MVRLAASALGATLAQTRRAVHKFLALPVFIHLKMALVSALLAQPVIIAHNQAVCTDMSMNAVLVPTLLVIKTVAHHAQLDIIALHHIKLQYFANVAQRRLEALSAALPTLITFQTTLPRARSQQAAIAALDITMCTTLLMLLRGAILAQEVTTAALRLQCQLLARLDITKTKKLKLLALNAQLGLLVHSHTARQWLVL